MSRNEDFHWRALALIFLVAIVVNYVWELAQAPLYVGLERYSAAVFLALFSCEFWGWPYGIADCRSGLDHIAKRELV